MINVRKIYEKVKDKSELWIDFTPEENCGEFSGKEKWS
jgi:hypothetical protein